MQINRIACAGLALLLSGSLVPAQDPNPTPAPPHILSAFDVTAGTIQDLVVPAQPGAAFDVVVDMDGGLKTLKLEPHDVRAPNFQLFESDENGLHLLPTPQSVTYRGHVEGKPGSIVAGSLIDGQLEAMVALAPGAEMWGIQPRREVDPTAPITQHLVYNSKNNAPLNIRCGVDDHRHTEQPAIGASPEVVKVAEIACDADFDLYQRNGSNTTSTQNDVTAVVNRMDAIYVADVEITYTITTIIVRTSTTYTTSNPGSLLTQFQNRWNTQHQGVQRDLAHLFTGKGSAGVIGIATLGTVCFIGSAYGLSFTRFTTNLTFRTALTAHECGHNWNSNHCDGTADCRIMCSGLGGCTGIVTSFGPFAKSWITAFKNAIGCLTNAAPPPTLTGISPNTTTAWQGGPIQLTGTNLDFVTEVQLLPIGGTVQRYSNFTSTPTTLTFTPSVPVPFLGLNFVSVISPGGTSGSVVLTVTGNDPPLMEIIPFMIRGVPYTLKVHSGPPNKVLVFGSFSNAPSSVPAIVSFQIGANFTQLWQIMPELTPDGTGTAAGLLTLPTAIPAGTPIHFQALVYDPANITLPLTTTANVLSPTIF